MSPASRCQRCGATLPPERQTCARCLLELAVPAGTEPAGERRRPQPPLPEELAADFPNLEITALIGEGGMGCVYRARHRQLGRDVALKILAPGLDDAHFEERFLREARAMARLDHPGIVRVHDFGRSAGRWYLTMEFISGTTLRQMMQEGRITARAALQLIPQLCDALQYAHDQGVVHRDIKPENVLIDESGRVKVADFGLAKILDQGVEPGLTNQSQVMGTLNYMAPEQMQGSRNVDHRADIFSLGVVFYEMLTGQLPVGTFEPPSHHAPVPPGIDAVVSKSLERTPERRYQHAVEVKTDVALAGEITAPEGEGLPPPTPQQVLAQACVLGAVLLLALGYSLFLVTRVHYRDLAYFAAELHPDHAARAGDRTFFFVMAALAVVAGLVLGGVVLRLLRRCGRQARLRFGTGAGLASLVTGAVVLMAASLLGKENALPTETALMAGSLVTLAGVMAAAGNGAGLYLVLRPGPDRARIAKAAVAVIASTVLWLVYWVTAFPLGDLGLTAIACAQGACVWLAVRLPRERAGWWSFAAFALCTGLVIGGACAWSHGVVASWEWQVSRHFASGTLAEAFGFERLHAPEMVVPLPGETFGGSSMGMRNRVHDSFNAAGWSLVAAGCWLLAGGALVLARRRIGWRPAALSALGMLGLQLLPALLAAHGPCLLAGTPERERVERTAKTHEPMEQAQQQVDRWAEQRLLMVIFASYKGIGSSDRQAASRSCLMVVDHVTATNRWRFELLGGPVRRVPRLELLLLQTGQEEGTRVLLRTSAMPRSPATRATSEEMVTSMLSSIGAQ